jgi:Sugar (and other) transporter
MGKISFLKFNIIQFTDLTKYVGAIIAAWTVFGTTKYTSDAAWRIPVGMQAAMPVFQFALIFCLPESPRWLLSKDRPDEALAVLVKVSEISCRTCE